MDVGEEQPSPLTPCASFSVAQIIGYRKRRTYYEIRKANTLSGPCAGKPQTIIDLRLEFLSGSAISDFFLSLFFLPLPSLSFRFV